MFALSLPISAQEVDVVKEISFPNFREVAKSTIPAVVAIHVEAHPKMSVNPFQQGDSMEEDPFETFGGRDFFERFFGMPRRGQQEPGPIQGHASGFIVSPDGYILTNNHVVADADVINILLNDGREFSAEVVGTDKNSDLAVLKIDADNLPFLSLGNSNDLEVGEWVAAIGNPLGLQASLTVGVVSAKGRSNLDIINYEDFIQTDAAINRGNSGGPLINMDGEVIGINTAIATAAGGNSGYMGISFAIPSIMAEHAMQQLIAKGSVTRGFLGVSLQEIDFNLAQSFGLDKVQGALVIDVQPDSPAAEAGLQREDILLEFNDRPITRISVFRNAVSLMDPGSTIDLQLLRDDQKKKISVTVGTFGDDQESSLPEKKEKLGIEVESLTTEKARDLGYGVEKGVLVKKVLPGTLAARLGIKPGAIIISINRQAITTPAEYHKAIAQHDNTKPLLLLIRQGEATRYMTIKLKE